MGDVDCPCCERARYNRMRKVCEGNGEMQKIMDWAGVPRGECNADVAPPPSEDPPQSES